MEKFKNKYRIASHRKPNWNYSADALYFLTIVTQNRECNLGEIVKTDFVETHRPLSLHEKPLTTNIMIPSDFGKIVDYEWFQSFEIRKELILHDFILMPNHLHTIVEIYNENRVDITTTTVETHGRVSLSIEPLEINQNEIEFLKIQRNPPIRLPKSISSFIAGFKSAVNTKIDDYIDEHHLTIPKYNRNNHFFQPNYHDHIIRNNSEYQTIANYIANNPTNWNNDKFYV